MPKQKRPVLESSVARDILNELEHYAKDKQFYPAQNALFGHMRRKRYELTISEFNYWFSRLAWDGYIEIDPDTRAIRAVKLIIVERDDSSILNI